MQNTQECRKNMIPKTHWAVEAYMSSWSKGEVENVVWDFKGHKGNSRGNGKANVW